MEGVKMNTFSQDICEGKQYTKKELKNKSGVYKIRNIVNNKFYIGSALDLRDRYKGHLTLLRSEKVNHHSSKLQEDFNKFGEDNFIFEVIAFCEPDERYNIEQKLLDKHWGKPWCYNSSPYAIHGTYNGLGVLCMNDGEVFHTLKECARYYDISESYVNRAIHGKYIEPEYAIVSLDIYNRLKEQGLTDDYIKENYNKLVKNHTDVFKSEYSQPPVLYGKENPTATSIICLNDQKVFDTIKECSDYYNRDRSGIVKNIRGQYLNPDMRFCQKDVYDKMIKDGYTHDYILSNYNAIIDKYRDMLNYMKGTKGKKGEKNPLAKSIICIDDKTVFNTIKECMEYYNCDRSSINKNIKGQYLNPKHKFTQKDMYDKMLEDGYTHEDICENYFYIIKKYKYMIKECKKVRGRYGGENSNSKKIVCLDNNKVYNTMKEIADEYDISTHTVRRICNGEYTIYPYNFKYYNEKEHGPVDKNGFLCYA